MLVLALLSDAYAPRRTHCHSIAVNPVDAINAFAFHAMPMLPMLPVASPFHCPLCCALLRRRNAAPHKSRPSKAVAFQHSAPRRSSVAGLSRSELSLPPLCHVFYANPLHCYAFPLHLQAWSTCAVAFLCSACAKPRFVLPPPSISSAILSLCVTMPKLNFPMPLQCNAVPCYSMAAISYASFCLSMPLLGSPSNTYAYHRASTPSPRAAFVFSAKASQPIADA